MKTAVKMCAATHYARFYRSLWVVDTQNTVKRSEYPIPMTSSANTFQLFASPLRFVRSPSSLVERG